MKQSSWILLFSCLLFSCSSMKYFLNSDCINSLNLKELGLEITNMQSISPSTVLEYHYFGKDENGNVVSTKPFGEYLLPIGISFVSDNAVYEQSTGIIKIKPLNEVKGDSVHIDIRMSSKSKVSFHIIKAFAINYEGIAEGDYSGNNGGKGSKGKIGKIATKDVAATDGTNGGNGVEGFDGKTMHAYLKIVKQQGIEFVKAKIIIDDLFHKKIDFYQVKLDKGLIKINSNGGNGGEGGLGGGSGKNGDVPTHGGFGGVGGNGGRGGWVIIHIDSADKRALNNIIVINKGGFGGNGGWSGDHPKGVKEAASTLNVARIDFTKYRESTKEVQSRNGFDGKDGVVEYKFEHIEEF